MLNENIKILRKNKGVSQEEMAERLSVVRQTISKWEKGLSVPDAEMLVRIAEYFEVSVGDLLGENLLEKETDNSISAVAERLEYINSQIIKKSETNRRILHMVFLAAGIALIIMMIYSLMPVFHRIISDLSMNADEAVIGGMDGPTSIVVYSSVDISMVIIFALLLVFAFVGIFLTRKK